jgi:hypothetical protein
LKSSTSRCRMPTTEDLCRQWVSAGFFQHEKANAERDWEPARRFWHGNGPEWDVVSQSLDGQSVLLGEVKWSDRPFDLPELRLLAKSLVMKGLPPVKTLKGRNVFHVLFVPELTKGMPSEIDGVQLVTGQQVLQDM